MGGTSGGTRPAAATPTPAATAAPASDPSAAEASAASATPAETEESEETAFELYATKAGTYLLRTHSYGAYENGRWLAAKEYDGAFRSMEALGSGRRAK